jgi:hypothetical protein
VYVGFIAVLGVMLCVTPAQALLSTTGYARIASQSSMNALNVAKRSLTLSSLSASIAGAGTGTSVAVRLVASGVGWPALGIAAGLVLAQVLLDSQQVQTIRANAAPGTLDIPGYPEPAGAGSIMCTAVGVPSSLCTSASTQIMTATTAACVSTAPWGTVPNGWANMGVIDFGPGGCQGSYVWGLKWLGSTNPATIIPGVPTQTNVSDYLGGLPASDPNSMESNTDHVGVGVAPSPASQVSEVSVSASDVATSVVPASSVSPTDTVFDASAPAPPGPVTTTETQTSTTTTTTTTNPDGSTTTQEETTAVSDCSAGQHDSRTLGTILQTHIETWKGSGIAGALSTLRTLTWPSASPTYTLNSGLLGAFSFDFTAWNGILVALRSVVIAGASFAAYRIIFVGGSGGAGS